MCNENDADSIASHIVPKYILKSILESDTGIKRAYLTASNLGHKPLEKKQDSPKELFLLCIDCEKKLENIETYCSSRIKLPSKTQFDASEQIEIIKIEDGLDKIIYRNVNANIYTLLVLSILWRLSASSFKAFEKFKLKNNEFEATRQLLNQRTSVDYKKFIDLNNSPINYKFSYVLLTSEHDTRKLKRVLSVLPSCINPYYIILGEFILIANYENMYWDKHFRGFFNHKIDNIIVSRINGDSWEETLNLFYSSFNDSIWYHLNKNKQGPHYSRI